MHANNTKLCLTNRSSDFKTTLTSIYLTEYNTVRIQLNSTLLPCCECAGSHDGPKYPNQVGITLAIEDGPVYNYPALPSSHHRDHSEHNDLYGNTMPASPTSRPDPSPSPSGSHGYNNQPPLMPQTLPPPTTNPSYFSPQHPASRGQVPQNYINMPPRRFAGQNGPPNLGMGLGAGALAAGTLIFGENLLPGPSFGAGLDSVSLTLSSNASF